MGCFSVGCFLRGMMFCGMIFCGMILCGMICLWDDVPWMEIRDSMSMMTEHFAFSSEAFALI